MIIVDASAAVEMLLGLPAAAKLMDRLFDDKESLHAPHLLDVEVAQVIRRFWRAGDLTPARGLLAIRDLADLPITRHSHEPLLERMWQLRGNATAYDAAYIALAEALGAVLVTRDKALAQIPGSKAVVEIL